jgi:hypothetical protein
MSPQYRRFIAVAATVLILLPGLAFAAVEALFDLSSPASSPFPSDRFAGGWPVAIFRHGFTDSKQRAPFAVASTFAAHGIATITINVVDHGGAAQGP